MKYICSLNNILIFHNYWLTDSSFLSLSPFSSAYVFIYDILNNCLRTFPWLLFVLKKNKTHTDTFSKHFFKIIKFVKYFIFHNPIVY